MYEFLFVQYFICLLHDIAQIKISFLFLIDSDVQIVLLLFFYHMPTAVPFKQ